MDLITKYSDKNKEGVEYHYGTQSDEGNDASDYILKNVYDEWNQEDGHVQSETTYDTLINEYVDIETEKEKLEVDLEHKKKLLAVFTDGAQSDDMSNKDEIEQSLEELHKSLVICIQVFRQLLMNTTNISVHITFQHFQVFRQVRRLM